jgi:hypothetical protein
MRAVTAVHSHLDAFRAVFRAAQVGVEVGARAENRPERLVSMERNTRFELATFSLGTLQTT